MPAEEVSAWETYEAAAAKQARQLTYRRKSVQAEGGRRQSTRVEVRSSAASRKSVIGIQPHSTATSKPGQATQLSALGLSGVDIKALEQAAEEAEKERNEKRSKNYNTQYSRFFDDLGFDRDPKRGSVAGDEEEQFVKKNLSYEEEQFVKKNLSYRVQEDILNVFGVYFDKHIHYDERHREEHDSRFRRFLRSINGTMPWLQPYLMDNLLLGDCLLFVELCFRGLGQVVFQNNPLCGLLILAGLFLQSSRVAVHGVISLTTGTLISYLLGFDKGLTRSGLFGYNAVLCGLAMATFYSPEKHQGYDAAVAIAMIIFSCFSSILFVFMGKLLVPYKSPPFTLPFNISVLMYLLTTANTSRINTGSVREPALPEYDGEFDTTITASAFFAGCIRGVGQIFLADNIGAGFLILAGMTVCSRISAAAALTGSALGAAVAVASGVPGVMVESGLYGFNCSLTYTAMYMFYTPSIGAFILATLAGIMTVLSQQALASFLEPYGLPFMTLPFCIISLPFVVLQGTTSLVVAVPLSSMTVPEDHLKKLRYLSDGFQFLKEALYPENAKDFRKSVRGRNKLNKSMKTILKIIEVEDDNEKFEEEDLSSVASSRHLDQSVSRSYSTAVSSSKMFVRRCTNQYRKKTVKGKQALKSAQRMWKALDIDNKGSIYIEDFTVALHSADLTDKSGLRFASLVFDIMDIDRSNSIEKKEWIIFCLVSVELNQVRSKISKFFDFVDADGSEYIDFDELDSALHYLGEPLLTEADRDTLLSVIMVEDEEEGIDIVELINYVTVAKIRMMMNEYLQEHTASLRSITIEHTPQN